MNRFIQKITYWLMAWCARKGRVLTITGTAGPEDVYLIRYFVFRSRFFNFFIHQFLRSDRDDLHDHPWDFVTYLVDGAYTERKWDDETGLIRDTRRENWSYYSPDSGKKERVKMNTFIFRRAEDQHQVVVDADLKMEDSNQAPLTICITGPTRREWGFVRERDPKGILEELEPVELSTGKVREWVHWKKYLGLPDDAPGRG